MLHIEIIPSSNTDKQIQKCYDYLYEVIIRERDLCKGIVRGAKFEGVQPKKPNTTMQKQSRNE